VSDSRFEIVGTQLELKAGQSLDRETEPTVNLTITATDQGGAGLFYGEPFTITVNNINEAPVTDAENYSITTGDTLSTTAPGVLEGDYDPEGDAFTAVLLGGPANGSLTLNADGSFTYTPDAGFKGTDSFTYEAWDGSASSTSTRVTIAVGPGIVPLPPPLPPIDPVDPGDPDPPDEPTDEDPDDEETKGEETGDSNPPPGDDGGPSGPLAPPSVVPDVAVAPDLTGESELDTPLLTNDVVDDEIGDRDADRTNDKSQRTNRSRTDVLIASAAQANYALMAAPGVMWKQLDEQLDNVESQIHGDLIVVGAAGAAASSFTVGVVAWALRSGFLASGLLAQLPAWRAIDPMLIMQGFGNDESAESLEELMRRQSQSLDS
jgi:hypothetical protein